MHVIYVLLFITLMRYAVRVVPWRRQLLAGLSTPRVGSHPNSMSAGFVVVRLNWNTFFSEYFGAFPWQNYFTNAAHSATHLSPTLYALIKWQRPYLNQASKKKDKVAFLQGILGGFSSKEELIISFNNVYVYNLLRPSSIWREDSLLKRNSIFNNV
jgi:hypothetical protein